MLIPTVVKHYILITLKPLILLRCLTTTLSTTANLFLIFTAHFCYYEFPTDSMICYSVSPPEPVPPLFATLDAFNYDFNMFKANILASALIRYLMRCFSRILANQ